jgi:hypothetical protein
MYFERKALFCFYHVNGSFSPLLNPRLKMHRKSIEKAFNSHPSQKITPIHKIHLSLAFFIPHPKPMRAQWTHLRYTSEVGRQGVQERFMLKDRPLL